ncbi:MAG: TetR/AcrR family transcriptional regulator [Myxococcales bacterium]|nr:TetR/AcrR family transcriptional regulator [Myxococcales bacterium]
MPRITLEAKAENRRRLVEAAADEFATHGLERANINRISLAAGLAKGTVYNHFASKEALFLEVVHEACVRAAAGGDAVPADASTRERLEALLRSDVEWARAHEPFAKVLVREALRGDPELYPRVIEAAGPYVVRVAQVLEEGVRRGEVRGDLPVPQLALVFSGMGALALVSHWGSGGAWPSLDEIPALFTELFLRGAAAPSRDER